MQDKEMYELIFYGTLHNTNGNTNDTCNVAVRPNNSNSYTFSRSTFFEQASTNTNIVSIDPEDAIRIIRAKPRIWNNV